MSPKAKDLAEVIPQQMLEGIAKKLEDYMDTPLIIHTCRKAHGQQGDYMRMVVSETEDSEQFYLATGATQVMEILEYLEDKKLFPIRGKFVQAGRAILLQSVKDASEPPPF